jgi:Resolvase, N terminal domain
MAPGAQRVIIYDRLSEDRAGDAASIENHLQSCRDHAASRGWTVVAEEVDRDKSGYKKGVKRPALGPGSPGRRARRGRPVPGLEVRSVVEAGHLLRRQGPRPVREPRRHLLDGGRGGRHRHLDSDRAHHHVGRRRAGPCREREPVRAPGPSPPGRRRARRDARRGTPALRLRLRRRRHRGRGGGDPRGRRSAGARRQPSSGG